jgi:hypothetical protein
VSVEKAEVERADAVAGRKEAMKTGDPIAIENAKELFASADANLREARADYRQAQASLDMLLQSPRGDLRISSKFVPLVTEKVLVKLDRTMSSLLQAFQEVVDKDCYDKLSHASSNREISKADYEKVYRVSPPNQQCMITGFSQTSLHTALGGAIPKNPVVLAHILPRSVSVDEQRFLGLDKFSIDNIRNTLLLCKGIEAAFDRKDLSFVPSDNPFSPNRFKMKIWNEAIKTMPIFEGSTQTIGDFDDAGLNLNVGGNLHSPFRRCLSYQAFRSFKTWYKIFGLKELPVDCDVSEYNGARYKSIRDSFALQLAKDKRDEAEENEAEEHVEECVEGLEDEEESLKSA